MRIMKKALCLALTLTFVLCLAACGSDSKGGSVEVYTYEEAFVEAGYEGDCINDNIYSLSISGDTYVFQKSFLVNQISGVIVASTKTQFTGTCTVTEADGIKTVTLNAPTSAVSNLNGGVTTSAEDPELLSEFEWSTVTCDTATMTLTLG